MSKRFIIVYSSDLEEYGLVNDYYDERNVLLDTGVTPPEIIAVDGCDPEDASLHRSYSWVAPLLNKLNDEIESLKK